MARGSFDGLYTFSEVGQIYGIDSSCLRKKVCFDKFVVGKDKMIRDERNKIKSEKKSKNGNSMNVKEEKSVDSWINGEIKGREVKSFRF